MRERCYGVGYSSVGRNSAERRQSVEWYAATLLYNWRHRRRAHPNVQLTANEPDFYWMRPPPRQCLSAVPPLQLVSPPMSGFRSFTPTVWRPRLLALLSPHPSPNHYSFCNFLSTSLIFCTLPFSLFLFVLFSIVVSPSSWCYIARILV